MTIRLNAKTIRAARKEVQESHPNGGIIKGFFEEYDPNNPDIPDRQVYESKLFKRLKSAFRRKTLINHKRTPADYFTFEPFPEPGVGE